MRGWGGVGRSWYVMGRRLGVRKKAQAELSVKVEVDVLGSPFLTVLMVSVSGCKTAVNERWESVAGNFQTRVNGKSARMITRDD